MNLLVVDTTSVQREWGIWEKSAGTNEADENMKSNIQGDDVNAGDWGTPPQPVWGSFAG